MPAFPLSRISQSWPRMWRTCGSFTLSRPTDSINWEIRVKRAHVRRQLGQFGVNRLVQRLDGPRHRSSSVYQIWYWRGPRSGNPAQPVNVPEPAIQLVPTGEIQAHHLFTISFVKSRLDDRALTASARSKRSTIPF